MRQTDAALRELRRPWLAPNLWVPVLLILVACGGVVYYGLQVANALKESEAASARAGGQAVAHEIVSFIDREHERLLAFTKEKNEEIGQILAYPDNWPAIDALQVSLKRMFRGAFAFSVTGPDGKPLFEDFEGLVGEICQASMRDYAAAAAETDGAYELPPIHPVPNAYHFDLISPWQLKSGAQGLFFISMSPDRVAELIAAAEQASGNRILLVSKEDPTLIEVSARGARDKLGGDFRVDPADLSPGHFSTDLPGTHWRLLVLPDGEALKASIEQVYLKVALSVLGLLLISAALLYLIRLAERRNSGAFMRSLQSSVSRQRAILQSMVDGMVTINSTGEILNVNSAVTRLFGYEPNELIGYNVRVLMPEPHQSAHDGYLRHYLDTGESKILGHGREVMGRRKEGSLFPVWLTLGESIEGDEHIFVGILHDMTAYKQAQEKLAAQAAKIERSKHEFDEISQIASNELQLPLQRIASLGEMLGSERHAKLGVAERAQLKNLSAEARDMSELAKGIADYTRTEHKPIGQDVDMAAVFSTVCADMRERIASTGATVSIHGRGVVKADEKQLRQVLWNLIDNALKFRDPDRAPVVTVDVESNDANDASDDGDRLLVRVNDNGIGIPAQELDSIFEAFHRVHPREEYAGMGLGLSFCRKIIDGLGGEMGVTSRPGEGSEFYFILPRSERSAH